MADHSDVYAFPYLIDYRNLTPKPSKTWEQLDLAEAIREGEAKAQAEREAKAQAEVEPEWVQAP